MGMFRKRIFKKIGGLILAGFLIGGSALSMPVISNAEGTTFTIRGLDLSKVHLVVDVPHEYYERFWYRCRDHLTRAGLTTTSSRTYKEWEPVLKLTINVLALGEPPVNSYLYIAKLEVKETVITERSPKVRAWVPTWAMGDSDEPELVNTPVTVEKMEADLDNLMKWFIQQYKFANNKSG